MRLPWNRGGIRTYVLLVGLLADYTTAGWIALGTPFILIGILLHLWTKGCLRQNQEVTTTGPYRFVRHPFYVANAFVDTGIALMSGCWFLQLLLPVWWLAVYVPAMRAEENTMTALFGDRYAAYRTQVPLVVPYRRPLPRQPGGFSWHNPHLVRTEVPRVFHFLAYPLMFVVSKRLHSAGLAPLLSPTVGDVLNGVACAVLHTVAGELRKHFKQRQPVLPSVFQWAPLRFAILAVVIAVGWNVTSFEVEADWAIWLPGGALLLLSAVARGTMSATPSIGEALLAVGLAVLFELEWFALLLVPLYLAIILDTRLREPLPRRSLPPRAPSFRLASAAAYAVVLAVGFILSVAKEMGA